MHIQADPSKGTAVASYLLHVRTKLKDGKVTDEDNQESDVLFKTEWRMEGSISPLFRCAEKIAERRRSLQEPRNE
jgi:hypothetical protein